MDEVKGLEEKLVLQRKSSAENDQPILKLKSSLEGSICNNNIVIILHIRNTRSIIN